MLIYWVNILSVFTWTLVFKFFEKTSSKKLMIVLFIQLFLVLSLRNINVGSDTISYLSIYNRVKLYPFFDFSNFRHEPGYILLNKFFGLFIQDPQLFISIMAFIPLMLIFRFINNESKIKWFSVVLFITLGFYTNTFNWFRQIISMAIILQSVKYVKSNEFKKFISLTILASLFHISALAFVPIYFVRNIKINIRSITLYSILGLFLYLFSHPIIKYTINIVTDFEYAISSDGGGTFLFVLITILIISLFFKNAILTLSPDDLIYYHILFFAVLIQIFALEFSLLTRVVRYFSIFLIVFIPNIIYYLRDKDLIVLSLFGVSMITLLLYYNSLSNDVSSIIPYEFFFTD